jgi:hypothetical protein
MAALLFAAGALLNAPLLMEGELPYRDSIEGGYASMTRFIRDNPNPWAWNPTQYGGLPAQFTYLPATMYAGAALSWAAGLEPEYAHRLVASLVTFFGPVTLFLFVLYFTRSRWWAFATAGAYLLVCPLYGLSSVISNDRGYVQLPWRLQVLAKYGEGPHNIGLTLLPLALIAVWATATGRRYWQIFVCAVLMALIALTNWIAALALAFATILMLIAGMGTEGFKPMRVMAAGALGYLLACFWLTPSFVYTVAFNWPLDAFNYHLREQQQLMFGGLLAGLVLLRGLAWKYAGPYLCFLLMAVFTFGWIALGFYWMRVDTVPESRRYALEFSLFLFAAGFELLRRAVRIRRRPLLAAVLIVAAAILSTGLRQARLYLTQGWLRWQPVPKQRTVEYRLARWLADHAPEGRVFVAGGVRFRLNSWFSITQAGGTFESGLRTRTPLHFSYQIRTGLGSRPETEAADSILQLKALGVEYIVVNAPGSKEHYRDMKNPTKFEGALEKVYSEPSDWIYRVPFRSYAHLVKREELPPFRPDGTQLQVIQPYVAAMEARSLATVWHDNNRLSINGRVEPGQLVATRVNYDAGWQATQDGRRLDIERDELGYMMLRARPAEAAAIELRYRGTPEQRLFAVISLIAWAAALAQLWRGRERHEAQDAKAQRLARA